MIDRNLDMRIAGGDPIALCYRRQLSNGATRELTGEVYAFTIYRADGSTEAGWSAASTIEQDIDGDFASMALTPGLSASLAGVVGLRWELAEILPGAAPGSDKPRQRKQGGALFVSRSAASVAGTASPFAEPDTDWIIEKDDDR